MGLIKQTVSNRFSNKYKDRLLFEWDNDEDTFANGGVLGTKIFENGKKLIKERSDFLEGEKFAGWK